MTAVLRALPWAIAMILIALGEAEGLVGHDTAATMFAILPALAVVAGIRGGCAGFRRKGATQ